MLRPDQQTKAGVENAGPDDCIAHRDMMNIRSNSSNPTSSRIATAESVQCTSELDLLVGNLLLVQQTNPASFTRHEHVLAEEYHLGRQSTS